MTRERGLAHMAALAMSYALSRKLKPGPLTIATHSHGELLMQDEPIFSPTPTPRSESVAYPEYVVKSIEPVGPDVQQFEGVEPMQIITHDPDGLLLPGDDAIPGLEKIGEQQPLETLPGTLTEYRMVPAVNPEVEAARPVMKTMEDLRQLPLRDRPKPPAGANRQTSRRYQHAERVTFGMALDQITAKKAAKEARRAKDKATAKMKKKARK